MLSRRIPVEIGKLQRLCELPLWKPVVSNYPKRIDKCLVRIDFLANQFSGSISDAIGPLPEYLSLLKNLSKVNFSHNKFSGNISPLAGSNSLTVDMTNNSFSGPIPSELVVSKNLTHLRLSNNFFTGKTPSEFGQLEDLRCLDLLFKNLTGDLAPSLAGLKTLAVFFLYLINFRGKFPHVPFFVCIKVWASGFSAAFLKKNSVATKRIMTLNDKDVTIEAKTSVETKPAVTEAALLLVLEKFFEVVLNLPTVNRRLSDVLDLLTSRQPSCPQLYIYSSADRVIPAVSVESFVEEQRRIGRDVRACNFVSTPHVDHFRNDPELYTSQLTQFLEDYVLSSCKQPS
ncbi:hypothetical protein MTR67_015753 [Solanum verrucosum]|uniref:Uncharacterized protein n=1 Tax=Solanum verrucosum TaxID=315347 RepID=A0AAF0QH08_SOLVR|nr:hypothetical protein MTR67_015753 [Solanum verrucosum]